MDQPSSRNQTSRINKLIPPQMCKMDERDTKLKFESIISIRCTGSDPEHVNFKVKLFVRPVILNDGLFSCIIFTLLYLLHNDYLLYFHVCVYMYKRRPHGRLVFC